MPEITNFEKEHMPRSVERRRERYIRTQNQQYEVKGQNKEEIETMVTQIYHRSRNQSGQFLFVSSEYLSVRAFRALRFQLHTFYDIEVIKVSMDDEGTKLELRKNFPQDKKARKEAKFDEKMKRMYGLD